MHVLIVEDNALNAYYLRRLLESLIEPSSVAIVNNSQSAIEYIANQGADVVIMDGDLGVAPDDVRYNGPELADFLLNRHPTLPIITWSDSELMHESFSKVFNKHGTSLNEFNSWMKSVQIERICKTWAYYFDDFMASQNSAFITKVNARDGAARSLASTR